MPNPQSKRSMFDFFEITIYFFFAHMIICFWVDLNVASLILDDLLDEKWKFDQGKAQKLILF